MKQQAAANAASAANGETAFRAYCLHCKLPKIEQGQSYSITDCIADLMHYAASKDFDPEELAEDAAGHYHVEAGNRRRRKRV
jgi:hypothetical protein